MTAPQGPRAGVPWQTMETGVAPPWPAQWLILLPDATEELDHALLRDPIVARGAQGDPVFSLTLLLERAPRPEEGNVSPLVAGGFLSLDLMLSVPPSVREAASRQVGRDVMPMFIRQGTVRLGATREGESQVLASATWSGTSLRAGLSAALRRDEALEVLRALDGQAGTLLRASYSADFRTSAADAKAIVSGYYAEVFDFLRSRFGERDSIQMRELEDAFAEMLARGIIDASGPSGGRIEGHEAGPALKGFLRIASPILSREADGGFRIRRERPHPVMRFEFEESMGCSPEQRHAGEAPLSKSLAGLLDGRKRDAFIRLTVPGSDLSPENPIGPAPRRMRMRSAPRSSSGSSRLAVQGEGAVSMTSAMRANVPAVAAGKLAHSGLARIDTSMVHAAGRVNLWWLDDVVAHGGESPARLPIVQKSDAPLWRDRVDARRYWYAPAIAPVLPAASADPAASPFLFSFQRVGSGPGGEAALQGTVRISARLAMSDASKAALNAAAGDGASQVPLGNLSVILSVPYLDTQANLLRRAAFQGSATLGGDTLTASFALINSSLRMTYGALSGVEPQSEPPRLEISYTYPAYVPSDETKLDAAFAGKISMTALAANRIDATRIGSRGYAEGGAAVFDFGGGEVRFRPEAPMPSRGDRPAFAAVALSPAAAHGGGTAVAAAAAPVTVMASPVIAPAVVAHVQPAIARPPLAVSAAVSELLRKVQYVRRTVLRQEILDLSFPCNSMGAFYREVREGLGVAIGCTQAIRLGQAVVRQYEEIAALATASFRVYRSLQQPERFLVLPAAYRITRYSPAIPGRGWRPAVAAFTVLDPGVEANNRILFEATLEPDLALHARRELVDRLVAEARNPVIEYPTEIDAEVEYAWLVGAAAKVEVEVLKLADSFQVSLATDLAGALLLKAMIQNTGVSGTATFRLPDGTSLSTVLSFELDKIVGPWTTGPLEIAAAGTTASLRNAIERPVDVDDVIAYARSGMSQRVPVDATLQPGETRTVAIPAGSTEIYAVAVLAPGTQPAIEEIRSFVEEVRTNATFIDLVNRDNHGLLRLDVEAQMKDVPGGARPVAMAGEPSAGSLDFLLPITTYLAKHVLQFRVAKTFRPKPGEAATAPRFTRWIDWDLETAGAVVSLTWDLLGEGD
ncbi:MAG: hypothetical protein IPP91_00540 [Betaproteobacteria bacterium]|nr:hypothetical protein [Betaproteobacteria bacterium]